MAFLLIYCRYITIENGMLIHALSYVNYLMFATMEYNTQFITPRFIGQREPHYTLARPYNRHFALYKCTCITKWVNFWGNSGAVKTQIFHWSVKNDLFFVCDRSFVMKGVPGYVSICPLVMSFVLRVGIGSL